MSYIFITEKSYFDSFKTFEVIDAESPIVIFFGTYGRDGHERSLKTSLEGVSHVFLDTMYAALLCSLFNVSWFPIASPRPYIGTIKNVRKDISPVYGR